MRFYRRWNRLRIAIPLILLGMILTRLVWMQLRDYPLVTNYRALIAINQLVDRDHCLVSEPDNQDLGLTDFVQAKELSTHPIYGWFVSMGLELYYPIACQADSFDARYLFRVNQWLFVATVMIATLMVRILTGSWILALISAATLLSRGRLVSSAGDLTWNTPQALLVTIWFTASVHFFRTGSAVSLFGSAVAVLLACIFDLSLVFLAFAMPLLLIGGFLFRRSLTEPVLQRVRQEKRRVREMLERGKLKVYRGPNYSVLFFDLVQKLLGRNQSSDWVGDKRSSASTGGLFEVIRVPFALWANYHWRWLKLTFFWLGFGTIGLVLVFFANYWRLGEVTTTTFLSNLDLRLNGMLPELLRSWIAALKEPIDLHLAASLFAIGLCAIQSPAEGVVSFFESAWLFVLSVLTLFIGALILDYWDALILDSVEGSIGAWSIYAWARSPEVLLWFEPIIICLGISGIYNLFKVARTYLPERTS